MTRETNLEVALALALSTLAGYVDAIGYLGLHGLFVSFMNGNSTQLGIALVPHAAKSPARAGLVILLFVIGVIIGELAGRLSNEWQRPIVLGLEAALLLAAAVVQIWGGTLLPIALMTLAMGTENNAFQRGGHVSIGLTYMTGALVRMAQSIAAALTGGDRFSWTLEFALWVTFIAGAAGGATAYHNLGLGALWAAASLAALATMASLRIPGNP